MQTRIRTSESDPLFINSVRPGTSTGLIGMTLCPGKTDHNPMYGDPWERNLDLDLDTVVRWGAAAVVSLVEDHEFQKLKVPGFAVAVTDRGMKWFHLPITDVQPPDARFRSQWASTGVEIRALLDAGHNIVIHCRGGLGRTGTIAAQLLVEYGSSAEDAITRVRQSRKGAIETSAQEDYVRSLISSEDIGPQTSARGNQLSLETIIDRFRGCLLGGAVGDALGAPVEFSSAESIFASHPSGIREFQEAYGRVGAITDDTQMTLFTAEACLRSRHRWIDHGMASLQDVAGYAYLRWLRTQSEIPARTHPLGKDIADYVYQSYLLDTPDMNSRRAPGNTCIGALRDGHPVMESKGCGGVMRVAPVGLTGFAMNWDEETTWESGSDTAGLTHGHRDGKSPAGYLAVLIKALVSGEELRSAAQSSRTGEGVTGTLIREALELAVDGQFKLSDLEQLGAGWVGDEAIAISLYCALTADDFESGVVNAASHSGDSDSTASITGQILGTIYGVEGIPSRWLNQLELRDTIDLLARDMAVMHNDGSPDHERRELDVLEARYPPN
jgi:ADP-ribosyl-[dinitrogen reductase] hydrolase